MGVAVVGAAVVGAAVVGAAVVGPAVVGAAVVGVDAGEQLVTSKAKETRTVINFIMFFISISSIQLEHREMSSYKGNFSKGK
jgi:hypothetical protein